MRQESALRTLSPITMAKFGASSVYTEQQANGLGMVQPAQQPPSQMLRSYLATRLEPSVLVAMGDAGCSTSQMAVQY